MIETATSSYDRRRFLTALGAGAAASCLPGHALLAASPAPPRRIPVGVQLWTLRRETAEDLPGTLKQVAAIGYRGVELWFQKWPDAQQLKTMADDCGLTIASAHVNLRDMQNDFSRIADYHHAIGNKSLVIPYVSDYKGVTADSLRRTLDDIRGVARVAAAAGFRLFYHNHAVELVNKVDGVEVLDAIFGSIDPQLLQPEIDVFFAADTGHDPAALLQKYAGRVKYVHLKEKSKPGEKAQNTELGRGVIDWPAVFAAADAAGVEWYFVEQNCENRSALDSIRVSYEYLRSQGQV